MRLIDADALIKFIDNRYDITWKDDYEGGIKDACTDILEEINKMPTIEPQQWIPCSERLPEERQEVLVTVNNGAIYTDVDKWISDSFWYHGHYVIAWMPLPEPYKGEQP